MQSIQPTQSAGRSLLPRTAQRISYADGDDGYFEAGWPRATRFVDHGNGTVGDLATGLQWIKQPELITPGEPVAAVPSNQVQSAEGAWATTTGYEAGDLVSESGSYYVCVEDHMSGTFVTDLAAGKWRQTVWTASAADLTTPATMTWANAVANGLALEYADFSDWRVPNVLELLSLVDFGTYVGGSPYTARGVFPNVQVAARYWSGTTFVADANQGIAILFSYYVGAVTQRSKTESHYVRPVRGGRINANWM